MSTPFPRGIEVLLKKAAVDTEFREILLGDPNQAAAAIELELEPIELAMLQTFPKEQLAAIIDQTEVPEPHRRAFLGTAAVAMLAVLAGSQTAVADGPMVKGSLADMPGIINLAITAGIQPVVPAPQPTIPESIPERVRRVVAEMTMIEFENVKPETKINLDDKKLTVLRREIYLRFDVRMPLKTLKSLQTVKLLTDFIVESLVGYGDEKPTQPRPTIAPAGSRPGIPRTYPR